MIAKTSSLSCSFSNVGTDCLVEYLHLFDLDNMNLTRTWLGCYFKFSKIKSADLKSLHEYDFFSS